MYTRPNVAPLTINTKSTTNGKGGVVATAAFRYTEDTSPTRRRATSVSRVRDQQVGSNTSFPQKKGSSNAHVMNTYPGSVASPPGMYVQALYDYDADDRTSLSFRQGDIIQVITQLESGWWDGFINETRGWFPSNYCAVVNGPLENGRTTQNAPSTDQASGESGTEEDEYDDYEEEVSEPVHTHDGGTRGNQEQEEAAFWIPQATPDGRLFYFNTLTGMSKMELPLETPTSANESGPRDRMNIRVPDQTRPPPEMMVRGQIHDEDEDGTSASEADGETLVLASRNAQPRRRRSYISDGASPSASMESSTTSPIRDPSESQEFQRPSNTSQQASAYMSLVDNTATVYTNNLVGNHGPAGVTPRSFYDDGNGPPLTWNGLVDNMKKSLNLYRQAINNADRSEYVRKAEDISDHLRMLLVAGSRTTDNHSGNPSIISTNKALYPHFRDMMSRFSKLVLSSHIAAADWPAPDSYSKCLQEAEGVLHGVLAYVEVARAQQGEVLPRLMPGFIIGNNLGGGWQNNNLSSRDPMSASSFMDQDDYELTEPSTRIDLDLIERMNDLKRMIVSSMRKLDEQLVVSEKVVGPSQHEQLSNAICTAAGKVIEYFRPWISMVESVNLVPYGSAFHNPQLQDFNNQKQRLYDIIANLVIACQTVAGPLSDEWAAIRGEPLENRLNEVRGSTKQLEATVSQVGFSLQLLLDNTPQDEPYQAKDGHGRPHRQTDGGASYQRSQLRDISTAIQRPQLADMGHSVSYSEGFGPETTAPPVQSPEQYHTENSKIKKFFGEVPAPAIANRESEETPSFLKLEYEGEISYDTKVTPPQLRGGTLIGLVEQLTRHDRLDSPFNNTFLLTYRSFTTATELFEMLVKRFSTQPPRGISDEDYRTWVDKKQKPIRFRVVNILKSWLDSYWMENNDEKSNELLHRIYAFAENSVATTNTPGSQPLMAAIDQRLKGHDANAKRLVLTLNTSTPQPIMPKNMKKLKFLDIDVTEFARQLTIIESRLYGKIKPTECLNKTWQRKLAQDEPEPAPNVKALILHSNQLTNWVAEMILTQSDVKKRVVVIKHFVSVADVCLQAQGFQTAANKS